MSETREILALAVDIGETLLSSGGEIYRVEDTVLRILHAFNIEECDVYVLTNGIFASAHESRPDCVSIVRNVSSGSVNLRKVSAINQMSREITSGRMTEAAAKSRLSEIKSMTPYPMMRKALAGAIGCSAFALLFGGHAPEASFAFIIGFMLQLMLRMTQTSRTSRFISNVIGAALVTCMTLIFQRIFPSINIDCVIIGDIMPLVPGIALTTAFRNLFYGDYLSGAINLLDALLTAVCIAVGVGSVMALGGMLV